QAFALRLKHLQWGAAEDAPAAGSREGIDAGLIGGDGDTAGWNSFARSWQARRYERFGQLSEVSKAGTKTEKVDEIGRRSVQFDDLRGCEAMNGRHLKEIGTEVLSIANGNFDEARFGKRHGVGSFGVTAKNIE